VRKTRGVGEVKDRENRVMALKPKKGKSKGKKERGVEERSEEKELSSAWSGKGGTNRRNQGDIQLKKKNEEKKR